MRSRKLRDMIYRLSMAGYAVISILLAGFGWFWWSSGGFEHRAATGSIILMVVAALAYVVVRALLFRNRQRLSALRRKKAS